MSRAPGHHSELHRPDTGLLLEVNDLKTHFRTTRGVVRAVDGVSFTLERGKTLGIVGESGCGKTILSRSVMGLLPKKNTIRQGSVRFEGREINQLTPSRWPRCGAPRWP